MEQNIKPVLDYCLARKIEHDTGVVTGAERADTHQYFEILAVGEGRYEYGVLIKPTVKPGDIVWVMKHAAEGDTPPEMYNKGLALFMASRVMAVETKS